MDVDYTYFDNEPECSVKHEKHDNHLVERSFYLTPSNVGEQEGLEHPMFIIITSHMLENISY